MTGRPTNPVLLGTTTNAAIRTAVAEQLRRAPSADAACPPRLRNLIDELRRQEETPSQQASDAATR